MAPRESAGEDVFLAARFLESTDFNPNRFGTHIVPARDAARASAPATRRVVPELPRNCP
ncbi:hypothetical protein [Streptomyces salinarius]|uniref:hypothetical protein n=1 Tax=Streptomyces salinarius TaxID=2762598 RepID=UPI0013DC86C8|nr:hypothetical protein [Streptomyces salinarius]